MSNDAARPDPSRLARRPWRALEPVHGMIYFAPEARDAYAALGLAHHRTGYFASRSAPMGPVPADVVIATFFNFWPQLIRRSLTGVWDITTPEKVLAARLDGADRALRRAFGPDVDGPELAEVAAIAQAAALAASEQLEGRPLFAGHAALPWPEAPHLVLWHAQSLLREFRGDGHVALLRAEGLSGVEALVIHGATGEVPAAVLQASRAWPPAEWDAAVEQLRARGVVGADGLLTTEGRAQRDHVEARTDALAVGAYAALSDDDAERLVQLGRHFSRMVIDAGLLQVDPQQWASPDPQ